MGDVATLQKMVPLTDSSAHLCWGLPLGGFKKWQSLPVINGNSRILKMEVLYHIRPYKDLKWPLKLGFSENRKSLDPKKELETLPANSSKWMANVCCGWRLQHLHRTIDPRQVEFQELVPTQKLVWWKYHGVSGSVDLEETLTWHQPCRFSNVAKVDKERHRRDLRDKVGAAVSKDPRSGSVKPKSTILALHFTFVSLCLCQYHAWPPGPRKHKPRVVSATLQPIYIRGCPLVKQRCNSIVDTGCLYSPVIQHGYKKFVH